MEKQGINQSLHSLTKAKCIINVVFAVLYFLSFVFAVNYEYTAIGHAGDGLPPEERQGFAIYLIIYFIFFVIVWGAAFIVSGVLSIVSAVKFGKYHSKKTVGKGAFILDFISKIIGTLVAGFFALMTISGLSGRIIYAAICGISITFATLSLIQLIKNKAATK